MVHVRSQPVQPRSSPNLAEVFPVLPIVPPQWHKSPGLTLRGLRGLRATVRTTRETGRFSWRTNMTAAPMVTTTTTMTPVAKYPNCLSRRQNVRRYCPIERGHNVLAGEIPSYRLHGPGHRVAYPIWTAGESSVITG